MLPPNGGISIASGVPEWPSPAYRLRLVCWPKAGRSPVLREQQGDAGLLTQDPRRAAQQRLDGRGARPVRQFGDTSGGGHDNLLGIVVQQANQGRASTPVSRAGEHPGGQGTGAGFGRPCTHHGGGKESTIAHSCGDLQNLIGHIHVCGIKGTDQRFEIPGDPPGPRHPEPQTGTDRVGVGEQSHEKIDGLSVGGNHCPRRCLRPHLGGMVHKQPAQHIGFNPEGGKDPGRVEPGPPSPRVDIPLSLLDYTDGLAQGNQRSTTSSP